MNGGKTATGYCPPDYCDYHNASSIKKIAAPTSCAEVDSRRLCTAHRKGPVCGEYEEGYSVLFHSESFGCDKCSYGAIGLLFYH